MDVSTTFQGDQTQNRIMGRLQKEFCLTCLPRGQSTWMKKFEAEQVLGNWLQTILTYLEILSLDVEVIMEVELNELKNVCIIPFKASREKHLVELNECRTLTIKFVVIGKTITSIEKTVHGNLNVLCGHVKNNLMVNELDYGLENQCTRERLQQTTGEHDYEAGDLRKTTTIDYRLKRLLVKLAPMFYQRVFGRKIGQATLAQVIRRQRNLFGTW